MKTLHVDTGRELRGGQRQLIYLLEGLLSRGEKIAVLARKDSPFFEHCHLAGWPVHAATLLNVMRQARSADLVHAHDARAHTLTAIASRKPLAVSRRVAFPVRASVLSSWKYYRANLFLPVSQAVARQLAAASIPPENIRLIYDAVPASPLLWTWQPGAPVVALASNDPLKGSSLIRSAAEQWGETPLVFSSNLADDLPNAAAFLYVTASEGLGSAALLAMSMGVPVIASAVEGLLEVFENRRSGLHVENTVASIAAAVAHIATDRPLAEQLSREGYSRVQTQFSLDAMVSQTIAAYRSLL